MVESLQLKWQETTSQCPDYKLIRWLVQREEVDIVNGFYRLESSPYGSLPEFFLVLFTPFEKSEEAFSRRLISDWTEMWKQDKFVEQSGIEWSPEKWLKKSENSSQPERILIEMLIDFQSNVCKKKQTLVFGLIPRSIGDLELFNYWIIQIVEKLPPEVKLSLIDHKGKNYLKESFKYFKDKALTIECPDMGLNKAIRQMATSGDQNSPEINFRKCVFEMADGVTGKNETHIHEWGKKALKIAQATGIKSFLASAYLIYAGFLMQLKKEESDELLDTGIRIGEAAMKNEEQDALGVLLQLYGYKAAYQSIKGKTSQSCQWLLKQARLAVESKQGVYAVSICRMAARTAKKAGEYEYYNESLKLGYHAGDELSNEELRISEIKILAYYYAEELRNDKKTAAASDIYRRMQEIFGKSWDEDIPSFSEKYGQSVPDVKESIEMLNIK